ncbi:(5-formylfuran-3-yl)methyl phosphate synthase [Rhodopirellula bahusiensis]|uniref:(5-formylfuran-3-yl)methyl phosphate synthase n=1 Tax=Rhodopirellula bahusiensis TaxID=2014065 RepID=UPI001E2ADF88|nr:(5-formylfuran-3-yl)methyl phosphate synthase [Rhodopirellula bahusiensis]
MPSTNEAGPIRVGASDSFDPELLVSVRDIEEAETAVSAGVSIVDFKEPSRGALAACDPKVWNEAAKQFAAAMPEDRHIRLSAALGESDSGPELGSLVPPEFSFAKVGPSGCSTAQKLSSLWGSIRLPQSVELVPVAYADHVASGTICPEQVLELVIKSGQRRMLVDTFIKDGRTLIDHFAIEQMRSLVSMAHCHGVWLAMAGSIRLREMQSLVTTGVRPDCWGVRGDVCDHRDRSGRLDPERIGLWQNAMALQAS